MKKILKSVGYFDGLNLKPVKFGGMNPTYRALERARALGFKTMIAIQ